MKLNQALEETTLWTHGGGAKTIHDPKRNKFASKRVKKTGKNIHLKDYEKAIKHGTQYGVWIWPIRSKM